MPRPGQGCVIGGIDTHNDTHTAAVLDAAGDLLGTETFAATASGYLLLVEWLEFEDRATGGEHRLEQFEDARCARVGVGPEGPMVDQGEV